MKLRIDTRYGFVAEDVQNIDPILVQHATATTTLDGHTFKKGDPIALDYDSITAQLVSFVQNFYSQFQSLVARVSGLETKVTQQQKEIDNLQAQINALKK